MASYQFGAFEVRPLQRQVLSEGQVLPLGARALDLLLVLMESRGALVTKSELLDRVWAGLVVEEANIQVQVSTLRKFLGSDVIATVPGRGYRFSAPVDGGGTVPPSANLVAEAAGGVRRLTNLPAPVEALMGREAEVAELVGWLAGHRLVAILGPGGIGKTRLAQEVGRQLLPSLPDGAWWIDLAALDDARNIPISIANALHLQVGAAGGDLLAQVAQALESREALLILDNCEHLITAVNGVVQALQTRAAGVRVLVTSQEALAAAAGLGYRLGPLALPVPGSSLDEARQAGAIQLLLARTGAIDRRFELSADNLGAAVDVVTALDGNPLAIEMAAARVPALGLQKLRDNLDERFQLLHRAARHALPRHRTLRATLEWSHALLSGVERTALRRLSAFVGSFQVDEGQRAIADEAVDVWGALDLIAALVDKSLVQLESVEPPRYRLLETVRLFCAEQCRVAGDGEDVQIRHGRAMAALAGSIEASYWELADTPWLQRHAPDYDDLRAAFERACARGDAEVAAVTGIALTRLDHLRSVNSPQRQRAAALQALLPQASPRARAWIWSCFASHGLIALDFVSRLEAARQAADAWRAEGDPVRLHHALGFQAAEAARAGDFILAKKLLAEVDALEQPHWPLRRRMWSSSARAGVCIHEGDAEGYRAATQKELDLAERAGAVRAAAWSRLKLADAALMAGEVDEAISLGEAAVAQLSALQQPSNLGLALANLCAALLQRGDVARAGAAALEALPLMCRNAWGFLVLDSVALHAALRGHSADALRLLGHVDQWYQQHGDSRQPNEAAMALRTRGLCSAVLGEAAAQELQQAGQRLSDGDAEHLAESLLKRT